MEHFTVLVMLYIVGAKMYNVPWLFFVTPILEMHVFESASSLIIVLN